MWEDRYRSQDGYLFGTAPAQFLTALQDDFIQGPALKDGERMVYSLIGFPGARRPVEDQVQRMALSARRPVIRVGFMHQVELGDELF